MMKINEIYIYQFLFLVRNVKTKVVKKMVTAPKGTEYVANVSPSKIWQFSREIPFMK